LNGFGTSFIDGYEAPFGAIALVVIRVGKMSANRKNKRTLGDSKVLFRA